ncbi:MAG: RdgB/HAM1 family non-canonical purine NTP pyrophosphatase [Actinobacteria bacterium]|jgi:XTP/dITP diphosphohydrolase|uniref:dITP/XTP pyrophosphatase n=1 Tax=freshwater metagenome TaxID=449393 RepID=A0A6J6B2J8_9ZZZZ|nr:RdgB/HAM1 family non-canonical purine NTP pyrophosphatase [Actinomycetota bacterium]
MAQRLVLATRNQGKIVELRRILDAISNGTIELVSVDQYPDIADVEETGSTFEENALLKAVAICKATGLPALADDSGLCVDALGGAPGIFSARYAGKHGDDIANLNKVLVELKSVEDSKRSAHFTCVTALVMPDGRKVTKAGEFHGFIAHAPVGEHGFGYDPIFIPQGSSITSAQMSPHEKDLLSHRGISLRAIAPHVIELLGTLG